MSEEAKKQNEAAPEEKAEKTKAPKESRGDKKKAAQLEEKLHSVEKELSEQEDRYKRVLAEYDNFRKRTQKEKENTYADAQISMIGAMLPVLDDLERGAAQQDADEGVKLIYRKFQDILGKYSVEECGKEGDAFDPNFHNAVLHEEGEGSGETVIAQVLQKGYTMNGRLIRAAMVKTTD